MDDSTQNIAVLHKTVAGHHRQRNRTLLIQSMMGLPSVVEGDEDLSRLKIHISVADAVVRFVV